MSVTYQQRNSIKNSPITFTFSFSKNMIICCHCSMTPFIAWKACENEIDKILQQIPFTNFICENWYESVNSPMILYMFQNGCIKKLIKSQCLQYPCTHFRQKKWYRCTKSKLADMDYMLPTWDFQTTSRDPITQP